ncbi:hypothetical protein E1261_21865 [Kribbella albertanoniae]|uniref:Uncharacterized protein n=1 Tax=Kribbella albertanoniae TaxID=1266829 RepID=A0A4R4PWC3_9ACTN|nr:hypothetical protein E1261_21865 [Kribbella albertanoniae]
MSDWWPAATKHRRAVRRRPESLLRHPVRRHRPHRTRVRRRPASRRPRPRRLLRPSRRRPPQRRRWNRPRPSRRLLPGWRTPCCSPARRSRRRIRSAAGSRPAQPAGRSAARRPPRGTPYKVG